MRKLVALGLVTMALALPISTMAASAEESDNESTTAPSIEPSIDPTARPTARPTLRPIVRPTEKAHPLVRPSEAAKPGSNDDDDAEDADHAVDSDVEGRLHSELEKRYGKDGSFQMPTLVVKPQGKITFGSSGATQLTTTHPVGQGATAATTGATGTSSAGGGSALGNAIAAQPIDFDVVQLSQPTPADTFFQSATIAIAVMGVGAVAFAGVFAARNVRAIRNPENGRED